MVYIHINKHKIAANKKHGTNEPVVAVRRTKSSKAVYCHEVNIDGPSRVVYSGNDKPILPCGARVVITTQAPIFPILDGKVLDPIK